MNVDYNNAKIILDNGTEIGMYEMSQIHHEYEIMCIIESLHYYKVREEDMRLIADKVVDIMNDYHLPEDEAIDFILEDYDFHEMSIDDLETLEELNSLSLDELINIYNEITIGEGVELEDEQAYRDYIIDYCDHDGTPLE